MNLLDLDAFTLADRFLDAFPEPVPFADFGPYRIRKEIGRGGMGEVYLAEDQTAARLVAIKFLRAAWLHSDVRERFAQEIKTLAKLEHPFIARLYDGGIHPNGTPYFAMEYVEGEPLDEYCRSREYSLNQLLRLFRAVCDAVQYAHTRLVVHRDLKPSNILIRSDGTPKLLDFGIAKQLEDPDRPALQTQTERRFTRAFAAPEQLRGEPVGVYTDVYALGLILYQLLAGIPAENLEHGEQEPLKPSVSPKRIEAQKSAWGDLDVLCLKAIKKDVVRRYHSVVELTQDIDRYLGGEPLLARPDTLNYRVGKFMKRNRRAVATAALGATLVISLVVFFTSRLARERDHANRQTAIVTAMNRFLSEDLLERTDPFKSQKSQEPFVDVVHRASSRIDAQFAAEPLIAARLHETIARAFENRSDFSQARREYDRAVDLFQRSQGPLSQDAIRVDLQRAVMEAVSYQPGSLAAAHALLHNAETSIARLAHPASEFAVLLPYTRGAIAIAKADANAAHQYFSEAWRQAQANPSFDQNAQLRFKELAAYSYVRLDQGARAEPLLRDVIQQFSRIYGPGSAEVLRSRAYLAQALMRQAKYTEAVNETNGIYPALVAQLGEDHQASMAVLGTRAAAEGYAMMLDQAIRDDLTLHNIAVRKYGPDFQLSLGSLSDAALSQCRAARYIEGESNARQAFREARRAFGPKDPLTGGCSYALAVCLIGANKLEEGAQLLNLIDVNAVAQLSGDSTVSASVALQQGRIAERQGDYAAARRFAQLAAPVFERPNADPLDKQSFQELEKALTSHTPGLLH